MSTAARIAVHRESASWELMSADSRTAVARAAGFNVVHTLHRIAASAWCDLYDHERTALYRVNWKAVIGKLEARKK
ncbi:MAG TPA: hypothetical protein VFB79_21440 [Candidatus Angelobacter sp.]|nr:hypothetical protein [Candidatus Angelobacter sp.]